MAVNTRIVARAVLAAAILLCLAAAVDRARAQAGELAETFEQAELAGWERSPGVTVAGGILRIPPGNFAAPLGGWPELALSARLQFTATGPAGPRVLYALRDQSHYALQLGPGTAVLLRWENGSEEELQRAADDALQPGSWLDVQLVVRGDQHLVSLNGAPLLTASDPDGLPPGGVAFEAAGESVLAIDEVRISGSPGQPGGTPPPASTAEATPAAAAGAVEGPVAGPGAWLDELLALRATQIDLQTFALNLALAAVLSFVLSRVYVYWGTSLANRRKFAANFMLISVTTAFIILVVRSSIALSLGLVGALSIIRFRTAVKEPEELAYLFLAVGLGIGLGDNQRLITVIALAAAILLIGLARLLRRPAADVNLHVTVASHNPHKVELDALLGALQPHCSQLKLVRFDENESVLEAAWLAEFRSFDHLRRARAALRGLSEELEIAFLDNRGIW
jgi:hypothetical protein